MKKTGAFTHVLIIFNPASTNSKRLKKRVDELLKIFPKRSITVLETSKEGRAANQKILLQHKHLLGSKTLLGIAAGDGTVNLVVETLLTHSNLTDDMRRTPILPLWGGNANDLAHMLNGFPWGNKLAYLLKRKNIKPIYPLEVTLINQNTTVTKIAACYATFGATAYAAHRINRPHHRKKILTRIFGARLVAEVHTISQALIEVSTFKIIENDITKSLYEYAVINGSRIAKIERMPVKLTDNVFYVAKIDQKHPQALLYIFRIFRRRKFGRITSQTREIKVLSSTWLQLDGEVLKVEADTKVKIRFNPEPFYAISRRLL